MTMFASKENSPAEQRAIYNALVETLDAREVRSGWERAQEYARGLAETGGEADEPRDSRGLGNHRHAQTARREATDTSVPVSASSLFSFCIDCGGLVDESLARLGSLRCHDCAHPIDKRAA